MTSSSSFAKRLLPLALAVLLSISGCSKDTPQSLVASGKEFAAKKDYAAASIQFKAALQLDPKFVKARVELGRNLLDAGDPVAAAMELTRALDEKAPAIEVVPMLARALVLAGDYKKLTSTYANLTLDDKAALAELKSQLATAWGALGDRARTEAAVAAALAAAPEYGPALILQARLLAGQRKFTEALAILDKVTQQTIKLHEAWLLKGEIQELVQNDSKAAAESFRQALAIERAYVEAHVALIGQAIRLQDMPAALKQADELRAALPRHPMTVLIDAQLAFFDRKLPLAREKAQLLIRSFPNHLPVVLLNGAVESEMGNLMSAEASFAKALSLSPGSWVARRNLSEVYVRLGQPQKALETLKPILQGDGVRIEALSLAGDAALRLGDATAAEAYFGRAAKLSPGNTRLQTALALAQFTRGDANKAFAELDRLAASTQDTYADEAIFSARMKRREFDAALIALDAMQKKAPARADLLELRGRVHLSRQDLPAARQAFEQALLKDKGSFAAVAGLTNVDVKERKFEQAEQRLKDTFSADPRNHYALIALAELRLTTSAKLDAVRKPLEDAIQIAPEDPQPRLMLIDLLLRKRLFKDALVAAQSAAVALPNDPRVLDVVGRAQMESGDVEQAITTYRRIAANDPNSAVAYVRLADIFKTAGRKPQAETVLRKALDLNPDNFAAQSSMIDLMVSSGRQADALAFTRKVQSQQPKDPSGYLLEGSFYARIKNFDAAVAAYRNGVAKTGRVEVATALFRLLLNTGRQAEADQFGASWIKAHPADVVFDYTLAETHILRREYAAAETRLRRVLDRYPNNATALNNMGWVLASLGKPGAVATAQRAVDLAPENASFLDTLAAAQASEKLFPQALATQQSAVDIAPEDHGMRLSLARIALQAGRKDIARPALERLRALGAAFAQQEEVNKLLQTL